MVTSGFGIFERFGGKGGGRESGALFGVRSSLMTS